MTDLAGALRTRLLDASPVTAIAGQRVYWVQRDQGSQLPAVVLQLISRQRPDLLDGEEDMLTSRVQAKCMAMTHAQAWALASAVRAALLPETEVDDINFWRGSAESVRDLGEQATEGFIYAASVDFIMRHTAGSE